MLSFLPLLFYLLNHTILATCDDGVCTPNISTGLLQMGSSSLLTRQMKIATHRIKSERADRPHWSVKAKTNKVLYGHMSKTAGTKINSVLEDTVSPANIAYSKEQFGLDDSQRLNFVIGSMRNPCEFYVSLWAFQSAQSKLGHKHGVLADMRRRFPDDFARLVGMDSENQYSSSDDVSRFREWLRYTSYGNGTLGLMTARFYKKYVELAEHHTDNLRDTADVASSLTATDLAKIRESMSAENVRSLNICWVLVETLGYDLTSCLTAFNADTDAVELDQIDTSHKANPSEHASCSHYYDEDTSKMVTEMDKDLFKLFGYATCCNQPKTERRRTFDDELFVEHSSPPAVAAAAKSIHDVLRPTTNCTAYLDDPVAHFPPSGPDSRGLRKDIDHVNVKDLTPEQFHKRYVQPNKPVILVGAASNLFNNATDAFSLNGIKANPFATMKQPVTHEAGRIVSSSVDHLNVHELFENPNRTVLFEAGQFPDYLAKEAPEHRALQHDMFKLLKDGNVLQHKNAKLEDGTFNLHLSNQGGALPHHHQGTINAIFHGAKRWVFVDPKSFISETMQLRFELQDIQPVGSKNDYTSHSWFRDQVMRMEIPYYDFVLEQGDAVFIPRYFTHATIDLCRETVGVVMMGDVVNVLHGQAPDAPEI